MGREKKRKKKFLFPPPPPSRPLKEEGPDRNLKSLKAEPSLGVCLVLLGGGGQGEAVWGAPSVKFKETVLQGHISADLIDTHTHTHTHTHSTGPVEREPG